MLFRAYKIPYSVEPFRNCSLVRPLDIDSSYEISQAIDAILMSFEQEGSFTVAQAKKIGLKTLQIAHTKGISVIDNSVFSGEDHIVKVYGASRALAMRQFFVMNALARSFEGSGQFISPQQYALFLPRGDEPAVVVMDHLDGQPLLRATHKLYQHDVLNKTSTERTVNSAIITYVRDTIGRHIHPLLRVLMDDLPPRKNANNILIEPELVRAVLDGSRNIADYGQIGIIDQAATAKSALIHLVARFVVDPSSDSNELTKTV